MERRTASRTHAVYLEVTEGERLGVRASFERNPGEAANGAAGTVAADEVADTELLGASIPMTKRAGNVFFVPGEVEELYAPFDADAARREVRVQYGFGLGLRDEEQERERGVLEPDIEKTRSDDSPAEMHLQPNSVVAPLDQLL